ncbi:hypothetical protein [Flavobacterium limi]|uniref:Type II secretion system protein GspC N-terminal domain-containing protein n=1 Tax=Flavobacterium limi TaxID=2045105 RepID=A0ABQ1U6W5_9FLAO|nr:hypothetical protein [Flavobacterium limi]GGF10418.1 hypothetical protein GCM10011518_19510 [Flavobacterium limi]
MKNKKNIYILLPIVLLVWGGVLYQLFSFTSEDEVNVVENREFAIKPLKIKERQTFAINVNYRDPFLGKMYAPEKAVKKTQSSKANKKPKPEETIVWPTILYKGMISDSKDKKKVFILIIDGKNYYMKTGDTQNEVFLKDGNKESVYVKYKGNLNLIMLGD